MIDQAVALSVTTLIQPFEGYHRVTPGGGCKAYPDPGTGAQPWTIGWGSTGPDINADTCWTREQADARLQMDVAKFAQAVVGLSPRLLEEPARRLAAIISFAYNCGVGNYRVSTLKRRVDAADWPGAAEQIVKWDKAGGRVLAGLTRRRRSEALLLA